MVLSADTVTLPIGSLIATAVALAAVATKVWTTCVRVLRWIDRQEDRWQAVDTLVTDWHQRGITPQGAVAEQARYRALTDTHTAALAHISQRIDAHDDVLDQVLDKVGKTRQELHELGAALAAAGVIDRRD